MARRVARLALFAAVVLAGAAGTVLRPDRHASGSSAGDEALRGAVRVIDADTFDVGGTRVRLFGVDAPEAGQTCTDAAGGAFACGEAATALARARWEGREASCDPRDRDPYGRVVAVCRVAGEDAGAALVRRGYAQAYLEFSADYADAQAEAQAARAGLWAGRFDPPWDWRAGRVAEAEAAPAAGCAVKGNVSDRGRIYHLPGSPAYARTRIDEGAGERWFCTAAEAEAAGWRAPRG